MTELRIGERPDVGDPSLAVLVRHHCREAPEEVVIVVRQRIGALDKEVSLDGLFEPRLYERAAAAK